MPPASEPFILKRRTLLNPGSQGAPLHLLRFVAAPAPGQAAPVWQAGDLVQTLIQTLHLFLRPDNDSTSHIPLFDLGIGEGIFDGDDDDIADRRIATL